MLFLYKFRHFFLPLATLLCISLFFSCSSDVKMPPAPEEEPLQTWDYCVYQLIQLCDQGPYSACQGTGGELSNTCPYSSSSSGGSGSSDGDGLSSSGTVTEYNYCVYSQAQLCDQGPYSACQGIGGELSNTCPYGSSSSQHGGSSSSSSLGTTLSSSSQGTTHSSSSQGGSLTNSFIDPRDGKRYKFEIATDGKVWMSENLNFSNNNTLGY